MVKYREAGLGETVENLVKYTSSMKYDEEITDKVILITIAHVYHLYTKKFLSSYHAKRMISELRNLYFSDELKEKLTTQEQFEDIFEALEDYLEKRVGESVYYLPLGRSRNDHVVAAIKLKILDEILDLQGKMNEKINQMIYMANNHTYTPFVIHTHSMPGQVTTYAHYLGSIIEELLDIYEDLLYVLKSVLKSPLGSAAGAGTSVNIDRTELAEILGFQGLVENTLYSTSSRIFLNKAVSTLVSLSIALSRVINDYILFSHPSINIINPPLQHIQTSSIMPQKKNPATLEVARARIKRTISNLNHLGVVESGLMTGYNLDLQELTPIVWESFCIVKDAIDIVFDYILKSTVDVERVERIILEGGMLATEIAETLSIEKGIPYRLAHQKVASTLKKFGWNLERAIEVLNAEEGLDLSKCLNWKTSISNKKVHGSPNPDKTKEHLEKQAKRLRKLYEESLRIKEKIELSFSSLLNLDIG